MKKMHYVVIALWLLVCSATSSSAGVSVGIGIGTPNMSLGINFSSVPELVPVPGYPVYYAPQASANYFFYDGMYWVFENNTWYASSWYNGPWGLVDPLSVPVYILQVPVRYYRLPPPYFRGWEPGRAPHWGEHWGPEWKKGRKGWDKRPTGPVPAAAPVPVYQRHYPREQYPKGEQQHQIHNEQYRYQPREPVVQQHYQRHGQKGPEHDHGEGHGHGHD